MSMDDAAAARAAKYGRLPEAADPATYVTEVPASPDDTPQPAPIPPAAVPGLIAATQFADGHRLRPRRRDRGE